MRRVVTTFLKFGQATGHPHPHLQVGINNYADLLQAMGHSSQKVLARLNAIAQPYSAIKPSP
ncbi:MAG: hypothetical protein CV088_13205 [Nitrospira sp. LK70]|nr:hypothetical protein [Nitrospira sp. LK70]